MVIPNTEDLYTLHNCPNEPSSLCFFDYGKGARLLWISSSKITKFERLKKIFKKGELVGIHYSPEEVLQYLLKFDWKLIAKSRPFVFKRIQRVARYALIRGRDDRLWNHVSDKVVTKHGTFYLNQVCTYRAFKRIASKSILEDQGGDYIHGLRMERLNPDGKTTFHPSDNDMMNTAKEINKWQLKWEYTFKLKRGKHEVVSVWKST